MAKQSVTPNQTKTETELANDVHWLSIHWKEHPLPGLATFHLARVDRCIRGATGIARIMRRFALGEEHAADFEGDDRLKVVYPKLSPEESDQLHIGMIELLDSAAVALTEIRDFPSRYETAAKDSQRG